LFSWPNIWRYTLPSPRMNNESSKFNNKKMCWRHLNITDSYDLALECRDKAEEDSVVESSEAEEKHGPGKRRTQPPKKLLSDSTSTGKWINLMVSSVGLEYCSL
jgi:hypothetical protein